MPRASPPFTNLAVVCISRSANCRGGQRKRGANGPWAPPIARALFALLIVFALIVFAFVPRKCESDDRVSNFATVGVYNTEVVPIWHVSAKGIHNELTAVRDVDNRRSRSPTDVGDMARGWVEGEQDPPPLSISRVEFAIAFTEENQIPSDSNAGLGRQRHFEPPGNPAGSGVGSAKAPKGMRAWNPVHES